MDYKEKALRYAEEHGMYEYKVNGKYMEYWSLYSDGFHFYRVDLDTEAWEEAGAIAWDVQEGKPVPAFLKTETGTTLYNYYCG